MTLTPPPLVTPPLTLPPLCGTPRPPRWRPRPPPPPPRGAPPLGPPPPLVTPPHPPRGEAAATAMSVKRLTLRPWLLYGRGSFFDRLHTNRNFFFPRQSAHGEWTEQGPVGIQGRMKHSSSAGPGLPGAALVGCGGFPSTVRFKLGPWAGPIRAGGQL